MFDPGLEIGDGALQYVIENIDFQSAIDIGCGYGRHSKMMIKAGKTVTSVDIKPIYENCIVGDYLTIPLPPSDLVWASHILEHQLNVHEFLKKCRAETVLGGHICIVVPPMKPNIVGGHLTLWNAGLVMYNLVLAGYDCSNAIIKQYGYNIMVIAKAANFSISGLCYDRGDIELISNYLPVGYNYHGFDGNIEELNVVI